MALVVYAASCEEQFLADAFPDEFKAYLAATPNKWLPKSARSPLPAVLDVRPAVFWKAFLDAGLVLRVVGAGGAGGGIPHHSHVLTAFAAARV